MGNSLKLSGLAVQRCDRTYDEFFLNGSNLDELLKPNGIPPFGWGSSDQDNHYARIFLGLQESGLEPNRLPLYICYLCGDYGCGVTSCELTFDENQVLWTNFGWEVDYEEGLSQSDADSRRRINFDRDEYEFVFQRYLK